MTFTSTPAAYSSVNDILVWVMFDANALDPTKLNYKYVVECWVDGVNIHTERLYPRPSGGFGVVDLQAVIRGYVDITFNPSTTIIAQRAGVGEFHTADVVIKVREEYNDTVGAIILTDSARVFFNHYNDRGEDQTAIAAFVDIAMTTRGKNIDIRADAAYYLIPYFATTTAPFDIILNGNIVTITPTAANELIVLNVSPGAINAAFPGAIDDTTESYQVVISGDVYTMQIVCAGRWANYTLHFLNKYGGFESMLFNKPRKRSIDIEKKEYQRLPYRVDGSGVLTVRSGVMPHEQRTQFAVMYNEKLKVQSDFISDADYDWLKQLAVSPIVYLEDGAQLYPVKITASSYDVRENSVDRLTQISLDIEFGSSKNTQYR